MNEQFAYKKVFYNDVLWYQGELPRAVLFLCEVKIWQQQIQSAISGYLKT